MSKSSALAVAAPLLLLQLLLSVTASPIRYDQRQDGDWNVDARLQNFFVVLAPSNSAQLGSSGVSLLDLASKAVPLRLRPQGVGAAGGDLKQREEVDTDEQGQEAKEVKSGRSMQAPLAAVAIPAAILQSPLAKLHPEVQAISVEEVLIARSPVVALRSPPGPLGPPGPAAAVPMLVAVPVPEVAPERPAAPPALLPMHPAGSPGPLGDKPVITEAVAAPAASEAVAPAAEVAAPASADAPAEAVPEVAPALARPVIEVVQPALETNQVEPETFKKEVEVAEVSKVHLIGTGIEECGPDRIRNQEGICVDAVQED